MERIKVLDSRPGSGKTSYALNYINELPPEKKIIYITPFLDEVNRVKTSCTSKNFIAPDKKRGKGKKRNHLLQLIIEEQNIVSTHALFSNIDDELIAALSASNYILVLDEVMDVLEKFDLWEEMPGLDEDTRDKKTKQEINNLLAKNIIDIDNDTGQIYWLDEEYQLGKYETFRNLALRELLFLIDGEIIVWTFPIDVFREGIFDEVYILTYQFDWQIQAAYYKYFGLEYTKYHIEKKDDTYFPIKTENEEYDLEWRNSIKEKIHIVDNNKLNSIGNINKLRNGRVILPLTKNWYDENPNLIQIVTNTVINFFSNIIKVKTEKRMWTGFVKYKSKMSRNNLSKKNWLPINSRATNNYSNKTALAYTIDRWLNPFIVHFFYKKGVSIDQDKFAVSELIQWIWRSAIRNGEEINVFIPSERMRTLLINFLENKPIEFKANSYYK